MGPKVQDVHYTVPRHTKAMLHEQLSGIAFLLQHLSEKPMIYGPAHPVSKATGLDFSRTLTSLAKAHSCATEITRLCIARNHYPSPIQGSAKQTILNCPSRVWQVFSLFLNKRTMVSGEPDCITVLNGILALLRSRNSKRCQGRNCIEAGSLR